jgi:hypothetical protein
MNHSNPITLTSIQIENIVEKKIDVIAFNQWRIEVFEKLKQVYKKNKLNKS